MRKPKGKRNHNYFTEDYTVRLNYQRDDGYWTMAHEITVTVPIIKPKCSHGKAEKIAMKMYPGCEIVRVALQ